MEKFPIIGLAVVLVICVAAVGALAVGFGGFGGGHPLSNQTRAAIEAGDYSGFLASLNGTASINETQFNALAARYKQGAAMRTELQQSQQAIANDDYATWKTALTGINPNADVSQARFDALVKVYQDEQKVQQAAKNNDFAAWKQAMGDLAQARTDGLTQADFDRYVKAQQAKGTQQGGRYAGLSNGPGRRGHWMMPAE